MGEQQSGKQNLSINLSKYLLQSHLLKSQGHGLLILIYKGHPHVEGLGERVVRSTTLISTGRRFVFCI